MVSGWLRAIEYTEAHQKKRMYEQDQQVLRELCFQRRDRERRMRTEGLKENSETIKNTTCFYIHLRHHTLRPFTLNIAEI